MLKKFIQIFGKKKKQQREITVLDFIGDSVRFDEFAGGYIWGQTKDGDQMIGEVRGWGAIQNLFKNPDGSVDFKKAEEFQDEVGKWIADAINYKILIDKDNYSITIDDKKGGGETNYPVPKRVHELVEMISHEKDRLRIENDNLNLLNKN